MNNLDKLSFIIAVGIIFVNSINNLSHQGFFYLVVFSFLIILMLKANRTNEITVRADNLSKSTQKTIINKILENLLKYTHKADKLKHKRIKTPKKRKKNPILKVTIPF